MANRRNALLVPGVEQALDQLKAEIAMEYGAGLKPDDSARQNGSVGGEMTKRLIQQAQAQFGNKSK